MTNHMIIGLGGTGGKIIRAFRKLIYQEFRKEEPDGVRIGYLYVDSSDEMMGLDDSTWKILGYSVQLPEASRLLIRGANLTERLDNIANYPGIQPWIGDRQRWRDILNSIVGAALGGQKRRLGRFLFACKAAGPDGFDGFLGTRVRNLRAGGVQAVTFHVLCGLAGGTGSGSVIDAVSHLRKSYPESRILVYALLPDRYPPTNWDTGNYHANGFAALIELNALSVGAYKPHDVASQGERLELKDPFNGCYVFTNDNENGLTVDIDKSLPNVVADFVYQKIVAVKDVSWRELARMENAENGDGTPETAPNSKVPERSLRFLTFGIKRLAIPEEEIREYLTFNFARQAVLQLRYNHWQEAFGFLDESRNQDFHGFVREKETEMRWMLSDDHLTASVGILSEDVTARKWKSITAEWDAVMPNFKSLVRERDRKVWLDELAKLCEKRYNEDYRGMGVATFYKTKLKARNDIAREIRGRIEQELFADWKNGTRSVHEIGRLLAALLDYADERLKSMDDKIVNVKARGEEAASARDANVREWANTGFFGSVLGKSDKLFDAYALHLQEFYVCRTRIEGLLFGKQLLLEIISELTHMKGEVDRTTNTLQEALKQFEKGIHERITDSGAEDLRSHLVRFYDPETVKRVNRALVVDEETQHTQTGRVRGRIVEKLGENPSFGLLNQRISVSAFLDILESACEESAEIAHNTLIQSNNDKLLGVSIIEKLKERYQLDLHGLKVYVTELVRQAGQFASFEPAEVQKVGSGIRPQSFVSSFSVILPKAPEHAEFVRALQDAFRGARTGSVEFIETETRANEITLVSITNLFPLRYLKPLGFLKERYEQRLAADPQRARLELHTDEGSGEFPKVYVLSVGEAQKDCLPYVLLAKALGMIQEDRHPKTGLPQVLLLTNDERGWDNEPIYLGKSFVDSVENLDQKSLYRIRDAVMAAIDSTAYQHEDQRLELENLVRASVMGVKEQRGGNVQDEVFRRFNEAGKAASKILRREA